MRRNVGPAAVRPAVSEDPDAALRRVLLVLAIAAVSALAVWFVSPRFDIETPSVVDDWAALYYSGEQLGDVVRFRNPEPDRFRPGVIAWTYAQWHTLDAPEGIVGPNLWNLLRIAVLVTGLSLLTAVALPVRRGRLEAVLYAGLAVLPAFVVVVVPKFARDLARFGPQEPLLVGGMALGGALLVLAGRDLLDAARPLLRRRIAALAVGGSAFWLLGVYQKETSVCALPLVAGVLLAGRERLRGWRTLSRGRRTALGALAAVTVLPLVHVALATLVIVRRGDLVYDEVSPNTSLVDGVRLLYDWAHEAMPGNTRLLLWGAVALTVVAAVVRRRVDWIALGALVSGALTFVFAGQSGVVATRYYIPVCALFAVAFALSLARLPSFVQLAGGLAVLFAFFPPPGTREEVRAWTNEELGNGALVQQVAELHGAGCRVAAAGLDLETSEAMPVLVALESRGSGASRCASDGVHLVLGPGLEGSALASACAEGALGEPVVDALVGDLRHCTRLRSGTVDDPELGRLEAERLVERRRFEPVPDL